MSKFYQIKLAIDSELDEIQLRYSLIELLREAKSKGIINQYLYKVNEVIEIK